MLPNALSIGVPYELFWHLTPNKLTAFYEAYKIEQKMKDQEMWRMGMYVADALYATVCNAFLWKKKGEKPNTYPDKPYSYQDGDNKGNDGLTEEEKQRAVDLFFAQEKARRVNWRRNHIKSGGAAKGE